MHTLLTMPSTDTYTVSYLRVYFIKHLHFYIILMKIQTLIKVLKCTQRSYNKHKYKDKQAL